MGSKSHLVKMTAAILKSNSASRDFYRQQFSTSDLLRGISNTDALSLPVPESTSMSRENYKKNFSSKIDIGIKENKNPAAVQPHKKDFGWNVSKPIWRELPGTPGVTEIRDGAGLSSHVHRQHVHRQGVGRDRATLDRAHYLAEMSHTFLGETCEKEPACEDTVRRVAAAPPSDCKNHKESEDSPWAPNTMSELLPSKSNTSQLSQDDGWVQAAGCFYGSGPCAAARELNRIESN